MVYAQTTRYARRRHGLAPDDREGAGVAHQDFLRAVLQYGETEAVHLFLETYPSGTIGKEDPALDELKQEFPGSRIEVKRARDLPSLCRQTRYIFCTSGVFLAPLAQVRLACGAEAYPISCLTHALDVPVPVLFFPGAVVLGRSYDALVTSSEAGRITLENLISATWEMAARELRISRRAASPRIGKIPLGIDSAFMARGDRAFARHSLGLEQDDDVLLYVGRLSEEQKADLEPLLLGFCRLLADHPNMLLMIAGQDVEGRYGRAVESMGKTMGISHRLKVLTNFPFFSKPLIYNAGDIFVSPVDNVQETFGLALLEAMACSLPVVASDWSGYRDLVCHGRNGFLVPTLWDCASADVVSQIAPMCHVTVRRRLLAQHTAIDIRALYQSIKQLV